MKLLLSAIFVIVASAYAFGQTKYKDTSEVPRIELGDAKAAFDAKSAVFIDSRPAEAYKDGHIAGAINIPLGSTEDFASLPKGKKIIVYCS